MPTAGLANVLKFMPPPPPLGPAIVKAAVPQRQIIWLGLAIDLVAVCRPFVYMALIDSLMSNVSIMTLIAIIAILLFLAVCEFVFGFSRDHVLARASRQAASTFSYQIWDRIVVARRSFFGRWLPGDILERVGAVPTYYEAYIAIRSARFVTLPILIVMMGCALLISLPLSLVLLISVPAIWFWNALIAKRRSSALEAAIDTGIQAKSAGIETLQANEVTQALDRTDYAFRRAWAPLHSASSMSLTISSLTALSSRGAALSQAVITCGILVVAAVMVKNGLATIGQLIAFDMFAAQIRSKVSILVGLSNSQQIASTLDERVRSLVADLGAGVCPRYAELDGSAHEAVTLGRLELRNVTFSYPDGHPVLDNAALTLRGGERVAIVGGSGAGKSTLGRLLGALLQSETLELYHDGVPVPEPVDFLRTNVRYLPQDAVLISGSLAENIFLDDPLNLSAADLGRARSYIVELGLETFWPSNSRFGELIDSSGRNLSGGQRQRIHLCRILIRSAPVIVVDEPTTALDATSAEAVLSLIERVHSLACVVYVTHDPCVIERSARTLLTAERSVRAIA